MNSETGIVMTQEMRDALARGCASPSMMPKLEYVDPANLTRQNQRELQRVGMTHVSRNAKCPCGSKKRFRKCHGRKP